jgi:hypothetical protein
VRITICTDPSLKGISFGSSDIWSNRDFCVSDGNKGKYLIIRGKDYLDHIEVHAGSTELSGFLTLPDNKSKIKYIWGLIATYGKLDEIVEHVYGVGKRDGVTRVRSDFHRVLHG